MSSEALAAPLPRRRQAGKSAAQEIGQLVESFVDLVVARLATVAPAANLSTAEPWMTIAQAAEYAARPEETIRRWVRAGKIKSGRDGRAIVTRASYIDAYLLHEDAAARPNRRRGPKESGRVVQLLHELNEKGDDADG